MPTAIDYPQPQRLGNAGYFPDFFIIMNDDSLILDIGRKAIPEEFKTDYNDFIKKEFNLFATTIAPFIREDKDDDNSWDILKVRDEIEKLPRINSKIIKFKNSPYEQEASVAAIFYELIGVNKCFIDFVPCYSAYRSKYDLYGYYKKKNFVILEFKYHLKNIVKDFKTYKKMADEINYIVCCNVSEEDESELMKKLNAKIVKIDYENNYDKTCKYMPETTHIITYSEYANPVYVIDLKVILERLNDGEVID